MCTVFLHESELRSSQWDCELYRYIFYLSTIGLSYAENWVTINIERENSININVFCMS